MEINEVSILYFPIGEVSNLAFLETYVEKNKKIKSANRGTNKVLNP